MKNALCLVIALAIPVLSQAGPRTVGNGGDVYALEFLGVGQALLASMKENRVTRVNLRKFAKAIDETRVESTNKPLVLKGMLKDAINYPSLKKIVFNRTAWSNLFETADRGALVLHEYLGIMGVDDSTYKISKKVIQDIGYGRLAQDQAVFLRKLTPAEMRSLYPLYLKMAEDQSEIVPSHLENDAFSMVQSAAEAKTQSNFQDGKIVGQRAITAEEKIKLIDHYMKELPKITPDIRRESSLALIKDFRSAGNKVVCELGFPKAYWKVNHMVECRDDRSVEYTDENGGSVDERKIRWSVDPKTLAPIHTLEFLWLQAG